MSDHDLFPWSMRSADFEELHFPTITTSSSAIVDSSAVRLECVRHALLAVGPSCAAGVVGMDELRDPVAFERVVSTVGLRLLLTAAEHRALNRVKHRRDGSTTTTDDDDEEIWKTAPRSLRPFLPTSQKLNQSTSSFSAVKWSAQLMEKDAKERMLVAKFLTIPEPPTHSNQLTTISPFHQTIYVAGLRVLLRTMTREELLHCLAYSTESKWSVAVAAAVCSLPMLQGSYCHCWIAFCFPSPAVRAWLARWIPAWSSLQEGDELLKSSIRTSSRIWQRTELAERSRKLSVLCCSEVWSSMETTQRAQFYPAGKKLHATLEEWVRDIEACKRIAR